MVDRQISPPPYSAFMEGDGAHIRLTLDTEQPIALGDFVANFVGIGNQFQKFIARDFPEVKAESEIFVKEVRSGSIEADLVAFLGPVLTAAGLATAAGQAIEAIDKGQVLSKFVSDFRSRLSRYFAPGGTDESASKSDLSLIPETVRAVAHDTDGNLSLEAAAFEDGERKVRAAFQFTTHDAREAEREIEEHLARLDAPADADHKRVMVLRFVRPSIEKVSSHRRTGERAVIEAIHSKPLSVLYASDLARERIQHELREAESNPFKLLFDVDVNVELSGGRPVAFRVVALHDVTDAPEDETKHGGETRAVALRRVRTMLRFAKSRAGYVEPADGRVAD